jgi:hypothetical protein
VDDPRERERPREQRVRTLLRRTRGAGGVLGSVVVRHLDVSRQVLDRLPGRPDLLQYLHRR